MNINMGILVQFCLILFIIALTVAVIMLIILLLDAIQVTKRIKREIKAVTFLVDILDIIIGMFHTTKKKMGDSGVVKKVKKAFKL
jgi:hypothetical protein